MIRDCFRLWVKESMKSEPKRGDKVMKLKSVRLVNYRCFTDTEIEFDKHITLLVGKNGTGKTAILDAVAVSVSTFLLGIDGSVSRSILRDDTRYEFHDLHGTIDPQYQFQVSIESIGDCLDQQNVKWIRSLNSESRKTTIKDASDLTGIAKKAQNQIMTGDKSLVLPLISYYGTGRLYAQKKEKRNLKSLTEFKRQVGYVDCMAVLVSSDAGTVFENHGIRFYINCREGKQHNEPHVHVDIRQGEGSGSFSLITMEQLSDSKIRKKDQKIIKETIENNQKDFLIYWNEHTDGLDVDLNQALGLINY